MTDFFNQREKVRHGCEVQLALAIGAARDDLGPQFVVFSKEQMFADAELAPGTNETLPFVGILLQLASEQDFDPAAEKIAGGRIARAHGLGLQPSAAPIEAGGKHPGIVEHHEVAGAEQVREVVKLTVLEVSCCRGNQQQARGGTVGQRLLSDQLRGQIVMKVGDQHAARL